MSKTRIPNSQNGRFDYIIELIKEKHDLNQSEIVKEINIESIGSSDISKLKSDPKKKIKKELIEQLENLYNVNPDFLKMKSNIPFKTIRTKLEYFEKFVDDWDVVKKEHNDYLHITMDSSFYDYLLELSKLNEADEEGFVNYEASEKDIEELYTGTSIPKKYVIIPCDDFKQYVVTSVEQENEAKKALDFILEYCKYEDYLEE